MSTNTTQVLVDPNNLPSMIKLTSGDITETICRRHFQRMLDRRSSAWLFRFMFLDKVEVAPSDAQCFDCTHN